MRLEINSSGTPAYRPMWSTAEEGHRLTVTPKESGALASEDALSDLSMTFDQKYFWTEEWQQKERLADWDILIGSVYEPEDVNDLIRFLREDNP